MTSPLQSSNPPVSIECLHEVGGLWSALTSWHPWNYIEVYWKWTKKEVDQRGTHWDMKSPPQQHGVVWSGNEGSDCSCLVGPFKQHWNRLETSPGWHKTSRNSLRYKNTPPSKNLQTLHRNGEAHGSRLVRPSKQHENTLETNQRWSKWEKNSPR